MSSIADTDDVIEVSADGLRVRKTFVADEFPVPAIRFEIESERDSQVEFRLSEDIPDSFPMDKIGFHPEYHSDEWTAFQDNHVEFTHTLEPGERLVTVYGIRIENENSAADFMTEPTIVEVNPNEQRSPVDEVDDEVIDSIVSGNSDRAVREMISDGSKSVPGLSGQQADGDAAVDDAADTADGEDTDTGGLEAEIEAAEGDDEELDLGLDDDPAEADDETDGDDETPEIDLGLEEEEFPEPEASAPESDLDDGTEPEPDTESESESETQPDEGFPTTEEPAGQEPVDEAVDSSTEPPEGESAGIESVAAQLADEIRNGEIDDDDLETLKSELDLELDLERIESELDLEPDLEQIESELDLEPDLEQIESELDFEPDIERIESELDLEPDLEKIESELDLEPDIERIKSELDLETEEDDGPDTAELAKIQHLQSRVEEVAAYTSALEEFIGEHGTGDHIIDEFREELDAFQDELNSMDDRVDDTETEIETLTEWTTDIEDDVEDVESDVTELSDRTDDLEDDLEDVGDVSDLEDDLEALENDVDDLESELEEVRENVTDLREWRDQLGSMFSGD